MRRVEYVKGNEIVTSYEIAKNENYKTRLVNIPEEKPALSEKVKARRFKAR